MSTAQEVREAALRLAAEDRDKEEAVGELTTRAAGRRVSLLVARRELMGRLEEDPADSTANRALELVDIVLERGTFSD
jgi:hypothetical protein